MSTADTDDPQVFVALEKRQDTFLSQTEWIYVPFLRRPKTRREILHDIALKIPTLLARADDLLGSLSQASEPQPQLTLTDPEQSDQYSELAAAEHLLTDFSKVKRDLDEWLQEFKIWHSPAPLYWETDDLFDSTYTIVDKHCIPNHKDSTYTLRFRDGQKAGVLICYCGFMLELLMSVIDLQTAISAKVTPTPAAAMRAVAMCRDRNANRAAADETAFLIMQSLPYLMCCLEGVFVAQLPLRVAKRYFARQQSTSQN